MSGGHVHEQEDYDHQVVIFTFIGKITREQAEEWNNTIQNFKDRTFNKPPKGSLVGVTIRGEKTPAAFRKP